MEGEKWVKNGPVTLAWCVCLEMNEKGSERETEEKKKEVSKDENKK